MRILHTGDLHIGKRLYGVDRLDEVAAALDEIATIAEERQVDAILVAGDIMDRRIVEPVVLSTSLQGLERLAQAAPVVAITGNHDEPLFWAEFAPYLAPRILIAASEAVLPLETASGPLTVACMPWPEPADVAAGPGVMRAESREAYADLVRDRLAESARQAADARRERGGPAVLLAHLMVRGGVAGGGEREMTLGGTYAVPGHDFPGGFDYIALGHLHQPQRMGSLPSPGRYCGSPLTLDFSGDAVRPSVALVTMEGGSTDVIEIPLTTGRRLVRLRGTMDELPRLADAYDDAWFFCEVVSDEVRLDLVRMVRERIPSALRVEQITSDHSTALVHDEGEPDDATARSLGEMYAEWLTETGRPTDAALVEAFEQALERAGRDMD